MNARRFTLLAAIFTAIAVATPAAAAEISGAGATFPYPIYAKWAEAYKEKTGTSMNYQSIGSGGGIKQIEAKTVDFGASDMPLTPDKLDADKLQQFPMVMGGVVPVVNLSGIQPGQLKLDGQTLAAIYLGTITNWNDKAIAALNPGVSLPNLKIITVHRADSSGSTFLFTSYLNAQDPADWPSSDIGTTITWPSAPGALAETGSGGMVTGAGGAKGSIAYIGISYLAKTQAASLGAASLLNKGGKYTQATDASINAALATFSGSTPANGAQSLINTTAPTGYPIINYEYAIVKTTQPSASVAKALKAFLSWTITTGSDAKTLATVGFEPLPSNVLTIAQNEIKSIKS